MKTACSAISVDRDVHSGDPVFTGTRVPVKTLFEHLESGVSLGEFLENFPTVTREQAEEVIRYAARRVAEPMAA